MSALEQELIEKISHLDTEKQRQVLEFVRRLEAPQQTQTYSALELMRLPPDERNRLVVQALERSANDDIEMLEAFDESDFDDE
jgi:hypothetical protein